MATIEIDVRPSGPFPQVLYECFREQAIHTGRVPDTYPLWDDLKTEDQQFWRSMAYRITGRYLGRPSRPRQDHAKTSLRGITVVDEPSTNRR